ncbi:MAG: YtxH domain-containing protein [Candidatus Nitrohelix vancouverensis]|uniref:YtxH domain-containing protein n=1 Tax=Candidatus Nitrohelix vancouverensis TaxID=2705534 RepID=A0A7T0C1A4_9BACT|nr:MAG: YtxH domain-containing protein [Candidatus Nitrohelix vancouverensis]
MNFLKQIFIVLILFVSVAATLGCKEKGPAEKAGAQIDAALEDASKSKEEAGVDINEAVEDAARITDEAGNEIGNAVDDASKAAKDLLGN